MSKLIIVGSPKKKKTTIKASKKGNARRVSFSKRMKRLARLTGNNSYRKIHFHTFRHAFALCTYHRTKDILHVKMLMGHKSLLTTFGNKFLHIVVYDSEESNQFVTKVTATKEERCELINDGWESIKNDGDDWYFRKPK
jgi:hypothetical protein